MLVDTKFNQTCLFLITGIICLATPAIIQAQGIEELLPIRGENGEIILGLGRPTCVAFSPDGPHFAVASSMGLTLWEVRDGKPVPSLFQRTGKIIFDMTSIKNIDIESPERKQKLENHLKAEDFFYTDSFPHAILEIKRQTTIIEDNKTIHEGVLGDLTIRGITHEIKFPFILTQSKNILTGEGSVDIDRTLYNIQYKSGKFFDDLGDRLIYDDFTTQFRVKTKSK